jgi:hypothetical protein
LAISSEIKYGQSYAPSVTSSITSRIIHNLIKEANTQNRLDAKDQRSTLLTLAERSTQASWLFRPAQAGAFTYTCTPGDGLRAQVLSASGDFAQTPALCPASSKDLVMHVNTLMNVTTITASSRDPPSDLPKQAKAGEHRSRKLHTPVYLLIIVFKL